MAEEDQDQKTEQPTGKRLSEARERGQVPISRETSAWVLFLAILLVVGWLGPPMAQRVVDILKAFIAVPHTLSLDSRGLQSVLLDTAIQIAMATGVVFLVLLIAAVLGVMVQTGFYASFESLVPDLGRLSPMHGIKRLFSLSSLVELGKSIGKLVVIGFMVFSTLWPVINEIPDFTGRPLMDLLAYLHHQAVHLIIMLMLVFTAIAAGDLYYQRFQYTKNLRMTKAEVKDEYRQQEGDPLIKSRLRQIRMEKARKRMMAQVPKADVVVTNPTHYAIAMQYDSKKMKAPVVIAKGIDQVAMRIRELADEHKIPLISNPPLARTLYDTVELDREIPTNLYKAVAEIISFVYKLKRKKI